jgi:hypothetical protein
MFRILSNGRIAPASDCAVTFITFPGLRRGGEMVVKNE